MKTEPFGRVQRTLIIHRALTPYRIDLFNALYSRYGCDIYFEEKEAENHRFNQSLLNSRICFPYNYLSPGVAGIKNLRWDIFKLIARGRYDLVLTSEINLTTLLALAARYITSPHSRIVSMVDDSYSIAQETVKKQLDLKKIILESGMLDGVILCDRRAQEVYSYSLGKDNRYHTFPILQKEETIREILPPLYPDATALRGHYTHHPSDKILLYVGRLSPEKNLDSLISAFSRAFGEQEEVHLVLVGDGPLEGFLRAKAEKTPCRQRIHFAGRKEGKELYSHYLMADAFVLASTLERFGAVANEALTIGLPCAISKATGIASMLQETREVVLFDPFSLEQIEEALKATLHLVSTPWRPDRSSLMPQTFEEILTPLYAFLER
ncbi:glycosyltransferase [Porphyromonas endodontalis]|uniref:glycosyltransferase n=1 Tax=Porphyromonas endodontalis TaxID=28124 RepID=UPI0023F17B05|nr:glycosyltransferase [Porphyromonas endodontalis]